MSSDGLLETWQVYAASTSCSASIQHNSLPSSASPSWGWRCPHLQIAMCTADLHFLHTSSQAWTHTSAAAPGECQSRMDLLLGVFAAHRCCSMPDSQWPSAQPECLTKCQLCSWGYKVCNAMPVRNQGVELQLCARLYAVFLAFTGACMQIHHAISCRRRAVSRLTAAGCHPAKCACHSEGRQRRQPEPRRTGGPPCAPAAHAAAALQPAV